MGIVEDLKKQKQEMIKAGQARIKELTEEIAVRQAEINEIKSVIGDVPEAKPNNKHKPTAKPKTKEGDAKDVVDG